MDKIQPKGGGGHTAASPSSTLCRAPVLRPRSAPPAGALMKQQPCAALAPRSGCPRRCSARVCRSSRCTSCFRAGTDPYEHTPGGELHAHAQGAVGPKPNHRTARALGPGRVRLSRELPSRLQSGGLAFRSPQTPGLDTWEPPSLLPWAPGRSGPSPLGQARTAELEAAKGYDRAFSTRGPCPDTSIRLS